MDLLYRTEELLGELIAFPTVSADGNLDLIAWAANYLKDLGAICDVTLDETGQKANLFASFGPDGDLYIACSALHQVLGRLPWQIHAAGPFPLYRLPLGVPATPGH